MRLRLQYFQEALDIVALQMWPQRLNYDRTAILNPEVGEASAPEGDDTL